MLRMTWKEHVTNEEVLMKVGPTRKFMITMNIEISDMENLTHKQHIKGKINTWKQRKIKGANVVTHLVQEVSNTFRAP